MEQSKLWSLNWRDFIKGLIVAIITPVAVAVQRVLDAGKMDFSWKALAMVAVGAGVTYILNALITGKQPTKTVTETPEGKVTETVITTDQVNVKIKPE